MEDAEEEEVDRVHAENALVNHADADVDHADVNRVDHADVDHADVDHAEDAEDVEDVLVNTKHVSV